MAFVGHGLVGSAMAGWVSAGARRQRFRYVWPGLMVLLAYAVDLAEWFAIICDPEKIDRRFVTHSPFLVGGIAGGVCLVLGVYCRFRHPWPYLVIAGVVFSHLLLDIKGVRIGVARWYAGHLIDERKLGHLAILPSECCVYGALLVWTLLIRASFERGASARSRAASRLLAVAAGVAAASRYLAIWTPIYVVSLLHAGIVLRRHLNRRWLWTVVPLLPLGALGFATWLAGHRLEQAMALSRLGLDKAALRVYQSALAVPTREGRDSMYRGLGWSYEKLDELSVAEQAYQYALAVSSYAGWSELALGDFYLRHPGTAFYRPRQAARLYHQVLESYDVDEDARPYARDRLDRLRERGVLP
ncbi:MAG: hypothetical protein V2A79_05265 [Planctomycetota bacterium]